MNLPDFNAHAAAERRLKNVFCYLLIASVAYCCFLHGRDDPPKLFWDENYHITSAERYLQGVAQFEPHPPLGLMLIAAGERLSGTNRTIDKQVLLESKHIKGDDLPKGFDFTGMRLMPGVFALLGALAFFGLLHSILQSRLHALLGSGLYLFENAFTVHFRAVHLDSFQVCFCIAFLWRFASLWQRSRALSVLDYAGLGVLAGLALMIKVNSVILLVLFPVLYVRDASRHDLDHPPLWAWDVGSKAASALLALLCVVYTVFAVHVHLSRQLPDSATSAGRQDLENMSATYRAYLDGQRTLDPLVVTQVIIDYFKFMEKDHKAVPKLDSNKPGENGSHPLHWPFHDRNISYRWDSADGKTAYVQLIGNQLMWYSGTAAVLASLILILNHRVFGVRANGSASTYHWIELFTGLYVAFMLMNLWLISQRVMYLYHYFLGLLISYVLLILCWYYASEVSAGFRRHRTRILSIAMACYGACYLFFLPLNNHWLLTKNECERRNIWISHIVFCR